MHIKYVDVYLCLPVNYVTSSICIFDTRIKKGTEGHIRVCELGLEEGVKETVKGKQILKGLHLKTAYLRKAQTCKLYL